MAALTWRDVAAPNFGSVNQALQSSGTTFSNALSGLADGLKQFQTERQQGIEGQVLGNALRINDPTQYEKALTEGSLLNGVDLTKLNPKVLEQLGQRSGQLLNQAATRQSIDSSKLGNVLTQQNIDTGRYKQDRAVQQDQIGDAARPEIARQLGLTGPLADLDVDAQQKIATTNSSLPSAALGRAATSQQMRDRDFAYGVNTRNDSANQDAIARSNELLSRNATIDDLRRDFQETEFSSPQARAAALDQVERQTGQRLYAPVGSGGVPTAGGKSLQGVPNSASPKGSSKGSSSHPNVAPSFSTDGVQSDEAKQALFELGRRVSQNSSAGVTADIERNLSDTRNIPEITAEFVKNFPGADQGKIIGKLAKAQSDNPGLSAADVASAFNRSISKSAWYTPGTTTIGDGVGYDDKAFEDNLKSFNSGRADYMSSDNQRTRGVAAQIRSADSALAQAKADLSAIKSRAASQPGIDTSQAQQRVDRLAQALKDAVSAQQENINLKPIRKK